MMRASGFCFSAMTILLLADASLAQEKAAEPDILTTTAPAPLASLSSLPPRIASANVRDSSGAIVGAVQRVEISGTGAPTRVDIALIGGKDHIISLDPAQLTYDFTNNEILTQSSAAQMRAMPHRG
jgi:hypothetical protein